MRLNFTNQSTADVFAVKSYSEFSQLMFDTAKNESKISKEEANDKIREIMFEVLGVEPGCDRKTLRKAIRRKKIDIYEVIEDTVENLLVSGWGENPFFNEFVETKSYNDGDTNEFYTRDEIILTVSELSGNHHDIVRQKLNEGSTFRVKTSWYGVKF